MEKKCPADHTATMYNQRCPLCGRLLRLDNFEPRPWYLDDPDYRDGPEWFLESGLGLVTGDSTDWADS